MANTQINQIDFQRPGQTNIRSTQFIIPTAHVAHPTHQNNFNSHLTKSIFSDLGRQIYVKHNSSAPQCMNYIPHTKTILTATTHHWRYYVYVCAYPSTANNLAILCTHLRMSQHTKQFSDIMYTFVRVPAQQTIFSTANQKNSDIMYTFVCVPAHQTI